ncbi:MAG: adenylate/guanylate cyclase domain-containing protein [Coleofasciculus sp. C2-GNP5-27]
MLISDFNNNQKPSPQVLIVDDEETQRLLMRRVIEKEGYQILEASDGLDCLRTCKKTSPDIILLDAMMPVMDGFACCQQLKKNPKMGQVPVLMITALEDKKSVNQAFEAGATDYVTKPIHWPVLLQRVRRLILQSQLYIQLIQSQERTERLLLNILPEPIAQRLQQSEGVIADYFENVSVLFADMVGFTQLSAQVSPRELVVKLNAIFSQFDQLTEQYGLEKIKTIGDGYMVAAGLPIPRDDHADVSLEMALAMQESMNQLRQKTGDPLSLRIGIHTGSVVAGVIGTKKFSYDLWGDTVNTASRMEQQGVSNCIQIAEATYQQLSNPHLFRERGLIDIKGKGQMKTYILDCPTCLNNYGNPAKTKIGSC